MKIIRRIFGNINNWPKKKLIEYLLKTKLDGGYFSYDLEEQSEEYGRFKYWVNSLNLHDSIIGTEFTKEEIEVADTLVFRGTWTPGYPQPEDPIAVNQNAYFDSCPECGIHGEQKAPLQMKEPRLGKHKIMQLNWIYDEIFVERDFYERFFKGLGIGMREPMLYKRNEPVKTVVQLDIPKAEFALEMGDLEFSTCPICKKIKYTPTEIGFFPAPPRTDFHMIKTREYFGSGHSSFNNILMSNEITSKLIDAKLAKYYNFIPTK